MSATLAPTELAVPSPDLGIPVALADTIAVLADEKRTRRRLEALLVGAGFDVTTDDLESGELSLSLVAARAVVLGCDPDCLLAAPRPRAIAELCRHPVVIVARSDEPRAVRAALRCGALGYVPEPDVDALLVPALAAAIAGQLCVPECARHRLAPPPLSFREKQVLELVANGLTNQQIAARLYLSGSTVKSHLCSSYRKLGVASRAEASAVVLDPDSGIDLRPEQDRIDETAALLG